MISAAHQFESEHPHGTIIDFLEDVSLASAVDRWNDDGGSVTLMTLHAAKGLEFPVAFIVGVEQNILPHSRANDKPEELEEERRLMFVGITRAERELYLSYCRVREFRGQRLAAIPSLFLREIPEDALAIRDLSPQNPTFARPSLGASRSEWSPPPSPPTFASKPSAFRLMTAADLARGGPSAMPSPPTNDELGAFQPGVTVVHPEYGMGRILSIEGAGPNRKGRVAFTLVGEKTFVLAKSPLKALKGR